MFFGNQLSLDRCLSYLNNLNNILITLQIIFLIISTPEFSFENIKIEQLMYKMIYFETSHKSKSISILKITKFSSFMASYKFELGTKSIYFENQIIFTHYKRAQ